jgi:hypothetical protein
LPRIVYDYPTDERLEFVVLVNSPCTPSELLVLEKIPVRPDTLKTIKKKLDIICKLGMIKKKKVAKGNVYWHASIEDYKKKILLKKFHKVIK